MEIQGYAQISKDATSGIGAVDIELFTKAPYCRVIEFDTDGCVLVIDGEASGLATFDKEDVIRSFRCSSVADVVCPPDLSLIEQNIYMAKCYERKGGYNWFLKGMVILESLHKGEFSDSLLWIKK